MNKSSLVNYIQLYLCENVTSIILLHYLFSEMCLEKALTVHVFLTQKRCPYKDLETDAGI